MRDWRWREEDVGPDHAHDWAVVVRGCLGRAIGWSFVAGAVLGGAYVAVQAPFRFPPGGQTNSLAALQMWGPMGVVQGAIAGLAVGTSSGFTFAALMLARGVIHRYRFFLHAVGAGIAMFGVWARRQVMGLPYPLMAAGPIDLLLGLAMSGLGGWWVSDRVARWYLTEIFGQQQTVAD